MIKHKTVVLLGIYEVGIPSHRGCCVYTLIGSSSDDLGSTKTQSIPNLASLSLLSIPHSSPRAAKAHGTSAMSQSHRAMPSLSYV